MSDLAEQIRDYLDDTSRPLDVGDMVITAADDGVLSTEQVPVVPLPDRPPAAGPAWRSIGLAAAAAIVVLGGIALVLNAASDDTVATADPPGSTAPTATTSPSTIPATTTTPVVEDIESAAGGVVPEVGTLVWELYEGDERTIPANVTGFDDGQYVAREGNSTWTSTDGITWTPAETPDAWADFEWVQEFGDFAIASDEEGSSTLFRRSDTSWLQVEEELDYPEIEGTPTRANFWAVVESDGVSIVPVMLRSSLGLDEVYGTNELWLEWDPLFESFRVHDFSSDRGEPVAALRLEQDDASVSLVDRDTDEVVVAISVESAESALDIAAQLKREGGLASSGLWLSTDGGDLSWVKPPWGSNGQVVASPGGGFVGYEFVYDWHVIEPADRLVSAELWTSTDGRVWQSHGAPSFTDPLAEHMDIMSDGDELIANVITGHNDQTGEPTGDSYTSVDGLTWEPTETAFSFHTQRFETTYGQVAISHNGEGVELRVSTDGDVWHEVDAPVRSVVPDGPGGGYSSATAAGDLIFISFGSDLGPRTLWVGRFER